MFKSDVSSLEHNSYSPLTNIHYVAVGYLMVLSISLLHGVFFYVLNLALAYCKPFKAFSYYEAFSIVLAAPNFGNVRTMQC